MTHGATARRHEGATAYCDRLTPWAAARIARDKLLGGSGISRLALLDGPPSTFAARVASRLLATLRVRVEEVPFVAGQLPSATGEAIPLAARKAAFVLADAASTILVGRSPVLARVNRRWGRETVRLWLARQQWLPAERVMVRVMTAEALAGRGAAPLLYLAWPASLPRELRARLPSPARLRITGLQRPRWKFGRLSALLWAMRQWGRRAGRRPPAAAPERPALLVPQEDEVSLDRSYRVQPHWHSGEAAGFRTIVLRLGATFDVALTAEERSRAAIEIVNVRDLAAARARTPVGGELGGQLRRLIVRGLLATRASDALAANEAARLLMTARELAAFCTERNVRAFMTCENYLMHADAMQIIARDLDIRTLAYQYSNMPNPSLPMQSTADRFVTFSPMFDSRFSWPGLPAPRFVHAGYVYDSAVARVEARARDSRARLAAAGATFVIGFFDESVQRDKYALIDERQHAEELLALLSLVERDPSVGLVFKTQFHHNLRQGGGALGRALDRALATGRVLLPSKGRHRNIVLPAEVARASDITIGHAFGGTASLEAALAGCRSLMVNGCGLQTEADACYARADILCDSVPSAIEAIASHRRGERPALGDWTPIAHEFDPFRDGMSDRRLRAEIEEAVCR